MVESRDGERAADIDALNLALAGYVLEEGLAAGVDNLTLIGG